MSVIVLLIVAGGVVAAGFLAAFAWAVRSGQFDDTATPAVRMLLDERRPSRATSRTDPEGIRHVHVLSADHRPTAGRRRSAVETFAYDNVVVRQFTVATVVWAHRGVARRV